MNTAMRASLETSIQKWLDENTDYFSGLGLWQDDTDQMQTAAAIAAGSVAVIEGMIHQMKLNKRFGGK